MGPLSGGTDDVDRAVAALRAGEPVVLPTDTVYGLCADAGGEEPVRRAYGLKGRAGAQPSALVAGDLDALMERVPELRAEVEPLLRSLLPGPYTLVVPNPAGRYPWLTGATPEKLGVRVPALPGPTASVLSQVGAVMATSANLPGGPDPARLEDVPQALLAGCGAVIDGGELPGAPSTVVDLTGPRPQVLREGAVPAEEALARIAGPVAQ